MIKPWFHGKIDFGPLVRDFSTGRFNLAGSRLDHAGERHGTAIVITSVITRLTCLIGALVIEGKYLSPRAPSVATALSSGRRAACFTPRYPMSMRRACSSWPR
jgi:hypothetical protein